MAKKDCTKNVVPPVIAEADRLVSNLQRLDQVVIGIDALIQETRLSPERLITVLSQQCSALSDMVGAYAGDAEVLAGHLRNGGRA